MTEVVHRMKRASLERLIEWLKGQDDDHWDMGDALSVRADTVSREMMEHGEDLDRVPLCHTAGCIAGHCVLLLNVDKQMMVPLSSIVEGGALEVATDFLGIKPNYDSPNLRDFLFTPVLSYSDVTREIAIQVLEHIRDHGVLHWSKFVKTLPSRDFGSGIVSPLPIVLY